MYEIYIISNNGKYFEISKKEMTEKRSKNFLNYNFFGTCKIKN